MYLSIFFVILYVLCAVNVSRSVTPSKENFTKLFQKIYQFFLFSQIVHSDSLHFEQTGNALGERNRSNDTFLTLPTGLLEDVGGHCNGYPPPVPAYSLMKDLFFADFSKNRKI